MRTRRLAGLLALALVITGGVTATARPRAAVPTVAPGYDLFFTPDGSRLGVDLAVAGVPLVTFRGVPLRSFDFGRHGVQRTGAADTVVRRLDAATPDSSTVRIELVGLLLESTNVPGYFVTLQSARPLGLPSAGTLEIAFDRRGGGTLASELLVNYDVRRGAPDGPIVASGSTGMGFRASDVLWQRSACPAGPCPNIDMEDLGPICHKTPPPIDHLHCVDANVIVPPIPGVNHRLNGRDTSADFHPLGALR